MGLKVFFRGLAIFSLTISFSACSRAETLPATHTVPESSLAERRTGLTTVPNCEAIHSFTESQTGPEPSACENVETYGEAVKAGCASICNERPLASTSLFEAVGLGCKNHVEQLLANGKDPNAGNDTGGNILFDPVLFDSVEITDHELGYCISRDLIGKGADVNLPAQHSFRLHGTKPIQYAAINGNFLVAGLLLDHGAHAVDGLPQALLGRNSETIELFLGKKPDLSNEHGLLDYAIFDASLFKRVMAMGAPFDPVLDVYYTKRTLLHSWEIEWRFESFDVRSIPTSPDSALIPVLLSMGLSLDIQNAAGDTPLASAIFYGNSGLAREMIRLGASPKAPHLLDYALRHDDLSLLQDIVAAQADWNKDSLLFTDEIYGRDRALRPVTLDAFNWLVSKGARVQGSIRRAVNLGPGHPCAENNYTVVNALIDGSIYYSNVTDDAQNLIAILNKVVQSGLDLRSVVLHDYTCDDHYDPEPVFHKKSPVAELVERCQSVLLEGFLQAGARPLSTEKDLEQEAVPCRNNASEIVELLKKYGI